MRPQDTRVWRKTGRKARRGVPTGRRATHTVQTTYGRGQRAAAWQGLIRQQREALAEVSR